VILQEIQITNNLKNFLCLVTIKKRKKINV
jgi:hypothetical protein